MEFWFIWRVIRRRWFKRVVEKMLTANDNLTNKDQLVSIIWQAIVAAESDGWLNITNNRECLASIYKIEGISIGENAKEVIG